MLEINNRQIGNNQPCYIVADFSANHNQDYNTAAKLICTAKQCGADAVKFQSYTPDTMTLNCNKPEFVIHEGTIWDGRTFYDLYSETFMPFEWLPKLKKIADDNGITFFSTPFDKSSVDYLESINIPVYKIASYELIDIPLIEYVASKNKPVILSTGMANLQEIEEAVDAVQIFHNKLALLKCTSIYPALPNQMNLKSISYLSVAFGLPIGLSDHTPNIAVPIVAVSLGACIIEKHMTLERTKTGIDSSFSLEPEEFKNMVESIRIAEDSFGEIRHKLTDVEYKSRNLRRSLFAVKDIKQGEVFTENNIKSIRPGYGLHPRYLNILIGKKAKRDLTFGTPLNQNDL